MEIVDEGFTAEINPDDPNRIKIVGDGQGGHTMGSGWACGTDVTVNIPADYWIIISTNGMMVINQFQLQMTYTPPGGTETTCTGYLTSITGTQYYYPDVNKGTMERVSGMTTDYRDYYFMSDGPITFRLWGDQWGLTPSLDLSIVVKPDEP